MLVFTSSFFFSLLFIYLIKKNASRWGLIDTPNDRSIHNEATPGGGGIGFFAAALLVVVVFHWHFLTAHSGILLAVFIVLSAGVLDDLHDITVRIKFLLLAVAALLLCFNDICIDDLGTFAGIHITLGWFSILFTIFAVVGFTNALNLTDGIDGLAASISIVILSGFWYVGVIHQDTMLTILPMALIPALLAFLIFNWRPASIFMGDSGSLVVGFIISILAIHSLAYLPPMHIVFIIAIPVLDTLLVIVRRRRSGRPIFHPDQCHLHHILKRFFAYSTPRTVLFLATLQAIYTFMGLHLDRRIDNGILLAVFLGSAFLIYLGLNGMIARQDRGGC